MLTVLQSADGIKDDKIQRKYSVQMPGDILERLPRQNVKVTISEALKIQKIIFFLSNI